MSTRTRSEFASQMAEDLTKEVRDLESRLTQALHQRDSFKQALEDASERNARQMKTIQGFQRATCASKPEDIQSVNKKLYEGLTEEIAKREKYAVEAFRLREENTHLSEENMRLAKEHKQVQARLSAADEYNNTLVSEIQSLKKTVAALKKTVATLWPEQ